MPFPNVAEPHEARMFIYDRQHAMSSISSIGGGDSQLYQILQQLRAGTTSQGTGSSQSTQGSDGTDSTQTSDNNPFAAALKAQGLSDSQISSLEAQIQSAVGNDAKNAK